MGEDIQVPTNYSQWAIGICSMNIIVSYDKPIKLVTSARKNI